MQEALWPETPIRGITEVRVRVADTDLMGVVYNSNYLVWFEIGRTELLRDRGISYATVEARGFSLPVTEAWFKVRRPARYDDLIRIETRVGLLRTRQVEFLYRLYSDQGLLVEGRTVHVPVTHEGRAATLLPDWIAMALRLPKA
ncbi:MAG: acyl-CoA thioesterase [Planctomycetaceae bacterium]|nr:MAG: acyl-CoA thioesterase [Planctomycetaceae bacterium]